MWIDRVYAGSEFVQGLLEINSTIRHLLLTELDNADFLAPLVAALRVLLQAFQPTLLHELSPFPLFFRSDQYFPIFISLIASSSVVIPPLRSSLIFSARSLRILSLTGLLTLSKLSWLWAYSTAERCWISCM
ncbi:hypothetical protein EYF80_027066 [Liparis tanakae]|uniref:Uncharacterized protein n=1 Tax=Liparis tanakae TaxID=230148 RepID=A0A4Z2HCV8_9TELE|nr:hypothetical protein EYF80_027066 [Liparis tanakae]